ncbi:MAG: diaminopimelate decarboxylase [Bacteroidales bacterium]|nr:diaminopimelate decarboxylase [Bacteroidales bacterium]MBN2818826.1 diaminopimelate decarboxylase [Bacteroidales bacterium]
MELINNKYQIDTIDVTRLPEKYGSPVYVYSTKKMTEQYNRLKNAFKTEVDLRINYACKALTNINVLKLFKSLGSGLDAVSIQEVKLALKAGYKPKDILFTPNGVSMEEIDEGIKLGVHLNIDNISILEQFGDKYGGKVPVGIRLNPHVMGGGNLKISTGHIDSKFGISVYQLPHLLRVIETNKMTIDGLHMHTGSDILDVEIFIKAANIILETAKNFKNLNYIDLGSGFKVPYKPDDYSTDIEEFGTEITKAYTAFCKDYGKKITLMFEPGKFLVSEAGTFLVRVNVLKHTLATVFAGVDSGLNHLIRPMFYDSYHHIVNVSNPCGRQRIYTVVGYICETDTFGWNRKISEITEGDILAFKNAGAYCFSMSSNYNSRFRPAEVIIHEGKDYLVRKREEMEDLLRNQIEIDFK